MLAGIFSVAATAQSQPSSWADEFVGIAAWTGLVPPHLQSNFTQAITRAEFAALAVALYENRNGQITGRILFDDTDDDSVEKAAYIGIVQGVGGNLFSPHYNISRQAAAVLLARVAEAIGSPLPAHTLLFSDMIDVSPWARESVARVHTSGIMVGVGDNRFDPHSNFSREQSIVAMLRVYTFAWGSPLNSLINVEGWEIEDWLAHDGWEIDFWGETSGHISNLPANTGLVLACTLQSGVGFHAIGSGMQQSLSSTARANVPFGGETRIRRINHGRALGSTYEIFLSDSNVQRLLTGFNIANIAFKVADVYSLFTSGIPTDGEQLSSSVKKKLASFVVTVLGSELYRVSRHSNGYGIIITTRTGAAYFVNERVPVRSQFDRAINPISFMVSHENIPARAIPNASALIIGTIPRGTVVNAIGSRFDASKEGAIWWLLDTGVWVHGAVLSPVGRTRITTTEYPRQDGRRTRGGGNILVGHEARLIATPVAGWEFIGWYENGRRVYDNATYAFTVTINSRTLEARFRLVGGTPPSNQQPGAAQQYIVFSNETFIMTLDVNPIEHERSYWQYILMDQTVTVRVGTTVTVQAQPGVSFSINDDNVVHMYRGNTWEDWIRAGRIESSFLVNMPWVRESATIVRYTFNTTGQYWFGKGSELAINVVTGS